MTYLSLNIFSKKTNNAILDVNISFIFCRKLTVLVLQDHWLWLMKLFIMVMACENKLVRLVLSKQAYEEKQCSE